MIDKPGKVIVREEQVEITQFVFHGVNSHEAALEALDWAIARLQKSHAEEVEAHASVV